MTITDIARIAGVSVSTVSKIINGKDEHINAQTRAQVLNVVKEYNFTPYSTIKNLSSSKKFLLGVLLRSSEISKGMLDGILYTAQNNGYGVVLLESYSDPELEAKHITKLCSTPVDGVIWEPASDDSLSSAEIFERHKIPYCITGNYNFSPTYTINFHEIGAYLTQKIVDCKHSKIACLSVVSNADGASFVSGFRSCLYNNHLPFSEASVYYEPGEKEILELLKQNYTAVVCNQYELALILYEILDQQHIQVPEDFSITCILPSIPPNAYLPHLSGISIPFFDFGSRLCKEVINMSENNDYTVSDYTLSFPLTLNHEKSISVINPPHKKILVVGAIHQDNVFHVDTLPQAGSTIKISNAICAPGGKGANQAIGVAHLSGSPFLIAAVGNDYEAIHLLDILNKENVPTTGICKKNSARTGQSYIYLEDSGESAITILPGANDKLTPDNIRKRENLFHNCRFCLLSNEIPIETVITAAKIARQNGVETIFKPAALKKLPAKLYENIDILIPNRREAAALCPQYSSVEQQADYFYQLGIPTVIITLGADGCYLKTAESAKYFPAVDLNVIDSTGGADAFISAFASYRSENYSLEQSIQIATIAAAFCVSRQGVKSALIDKNSLELYIAKEQSDLLH